MAKNNQQLAQRFQQQGGAPTTLSFEGNLREWFKGKANTIHGLLGSKDESKRMMAAFVDSVSRNPTLLNCSFESLTLCFMHSASLHLYPGPMQECAYLPFKGKATFTPMYQGLCKLAYNSGHVRSISANVVKEGDDFEYEEGTSAHLRHVPLMDEDERGSIICAWAVVETKFGKTITVKSAKFIEGIRKRAPSAKNSSPWDTDYDEMAKKTVIKQALKTIPKSPQMAAAIELDNAAERPDLARGAKIIDIDPESVVQGDEEQKQISSEQAVNDESGEDPSGEVVE